MLSSVTEAKSLGFCNYELSCYLGKPVPGQRVWVKTAELRSRKIELSYQSESGRYLGIIRNIRIGTELRFYVDHSDRKIAFVPFEECETVFGRVRVPDLDPCWNAGQDLSLNRQVQGHGALQFQILLEATLEGLLADYQGGLHAPNSMEQLLELSIAARVNQTQIPERLAEMGYTELMLPIFSSVADRTKLNPKFNYLVYNLSLDWQLGTHREMRQLVQRFRRAGIELVPDLVFVHQVSDPYDGSITDWARRTGERSVFEDADPYLFRDYGTWMFNLSDPQVRQIIVDKICHLVRSLDLNRIRVDYIDGLVLQYSGRQDNWGCALLEELRTALAARCPGLEIIGEAFSTAMEPAVQRLISSSYSPRGFQLLETLLRPGYPDLFHTGATVDQICKSMEAANRQSARESNYAQLHDECWSDVFIEQGRPYTPWAHGKMPLGLALEQTQRLREQGFIETDQRLSFSIRLTALVTVLGMVMSFHRWMETVGAISLDCGRLDEEDHWKFLWSPSDRLNRAIWQEVGKEATLLASELIDFRQALVATRQALQRLGPVDAHPPGPPLQIIHRDYQNGLIAMKRWGEQRPDPILVIANLAPYRLNQDHNYEIPISNLDVHKMQPICNFALNSKHPQRLLIASPASVKLARPVEAYEVAVFGDLV